MKGIMFIEELYAASFDLCIKDVTRRSGGMDEVNANPNQWDKPVNAEEGDYWTLKRVSHPALRTPVLSKYCMIIPRYQTGEIVYVKEPYAFTGHGMQYRYGAKLKFSTKNKMFMPAKYARRFVQIVAAWPERLHEMTDLEAELEGMGIFHNRGKIRPYADHWYMLKFIEKWDEINGPGSWESNPWVWRYQYRALDPREAIDLARKSGVNVDDKWVLYHQILRNIAASEHVLYLHSFPTS